jgi:hypothetical protein
MEHAHLQNHPRTSRYTVDIIFIPYLSHITCKSSATSDNRSGNNDFCSNRKKWSFGVVKVGGTLGSMTERERTKNQANRSRNEQDMIQKCWEVQSCPFWGKVAVARISENGCNPIFKIHGEAMDLGSFKFSIFYPTFHCKIKLGGVGQCCAWHI